MSRPVSNDETGRLLAIGEEDQRFEEAPHIAGAHSACFGNRSAYPAPRSLQQYRLPQDRAGHANAVCPLGDRTPPAAGSPNTRSTPQPRPRSTSRGRARIQHLRRRVSQGRAPCAGQKRDSHPADRGIPPRQRMDHGRRSRRCRQEALRPSRAVRPVSRYKVGAADVSCTGTPSRNGPRSRPAL